MTPRRGILLSVLLGAATTLAVAWSLALAPARRHWIFSGMPIDPPPVSTAARQVSIEHETGPGDEWVQLSVVVLREGTLPGGVKCLELAGTYASMGPVLTTEPPWRLGDSTAPEVYAAIAAFPQPPWPSWLPSLPRGSRGLLSYGARASGWPLKCLRSVSTLDTPGGELRWRGSCRIISRSAYKPPYARGPQFGCIPLFPVPLAFAADSAIFGAAWSIPLVAPGLLRARRRRRRGLCPRCGYDARGAPSCPECGRATA